MMAKLIDLILPICFSKLDILTLKYTLFVMVQIVLLIYRNNQYSNTTLGIFN